MFSMFSMCSELTPRAPIPDGRMERFMHPCNNVSSFHSQQHVNPSQSDVLISQLQLVMLSLQQDVDKYPCQRSSNQSQFTFDRCILKELQDLQVLLGKLVFCPTSGSTYLLSLVVYLFSSLCMFHLKFHF